MATDQHVAAEVLLMILIAASGDKPITEGRFQAAVTCWRCLAREAGIPAEVIDGWVKEHLTEEED